MVRREFLADFGRELKAWRHTMRMTQRELADELGYDVTYVVKIEGGRRPPTRQFMARLAQMPGEPLEALSQASASDILRPALPQPPGALIGREAEVQGLVARILGGARCVTLLGPPGIGKTRLAIEAAIQVDAVLSGGSWWVSLVEVQRVEDAADHIAQALGIRREGPSDAVELLLERLRGQQALLVLDNFEHIMGARTVVSDLVTGAPRLTVLVTSREALGLVSENVVPVAPLAFPDPTHQPSLATVECSSAVELFVARAKMIRPGFRLTESNYGDVLETCAHLDGLPLAIVLTAGVLGASPGTRVGHIDLSLDQPHVAPADMPADHRTLGAAILRSWRLLDSDEQTLFATLAVFSAGFTAGAAAAVAGTADAQGLDTVLQRLDALARKSLLEVRPDAPGGPRFQMLETIRAFARARLDERGRADDVHRRHAAFFVGFAEDAGRRFTGHDQVQSLEAFREEFDNLRIAFEWALSADPEGAIRLAASLWRLFLVRDLPTGRRWLEQALAVSPQPSVHRAIALAGAGACGWITGHFDVAARCLAEAKLLAERLGVPEVAALAALNEGAARRSNKIDSTTPTAGSARHFGSTTRPTIVVGALPASSAWA